MTEYGALLLGMVLCALVPIVLIAAASWIGPRRTGPEKDRPFETGYVLPAPRRRPYSPNFLRYAILFVVFDMEIAFLYPWAVSFHRIGTTGFLVGLFFLLLLDFALVYAWWKGALEWE